MRKRSIAMALAIVACTHEPVFTPSAPAGSKVPRDTGVVHAVTHSGTDGFPSWLPDGSGLTYSFRSADSPPLNLRCLATIPAAGGTREALSCKVRAAGDSVDESDFPTPGLGDELAYSWVVWRSKAYIPDSMLVLVGSLSSPGDATSVFKFPATLGQRLYSKVTHLAWFDAHTLAASGAVATIVQDCLGCPFRTVYAGRNILLLDITTRPATVTLVPNTSPATSVAVAAPGEIYYTLTGDSRVYRRVIATGDSGVVHDFGGAGIARDVQVSGDRLVAIVGGSITVANDPVVGVFQTDSGGFIHVVTLSTDADSVLPDSGYLFRHPALSPSADRVAAEAWLGGVRNLWVFHLP